MEKRVKVALKEIKNALKKALDGCSEMEVLMVTTFIAAGFQEVFGEALDEAKLCLSGDKAATPEPIGAENMPDTQVSGGEEHVE